VALKRFHPHLVANPVARARIEEEAAAASRVTHPNIVSAIDVVDDRNGLALVFPFVDGVTLAERLAGGPRLPARPAAAIALDIADALAVAHASGVLHRDVKPANILIATDGTARLLDFGIAHAVDELDENQRLTGAGMAIGTLPYMAPEQLSAGRITPASDVYGLGVVLYEMLAARQPYEAASPVTLAKEQAQPPAAIDGVPAALNDLTLSALASEAALRPDAAQFARGLRAWLDGRTDAEAATAAFLAPRVQPAAPAPPASKPRLGLIAAGLAALVVAIGLPVAVAALVTPAPSPLETARGVSAAPTQSVPTPLKTPTPTQAPVVAATNPEPPPKSTTGGGPAGGKHHHHKHHKHHRHHHHHGGHG
jgi:serine/threonine-protein kinase